MLTDAQRRARLILQGRLNNTQIAQLTDCSRNTVRSWRKSLKQLGVDLGEIEELDDMEIRKLVIPGSFARVHQFDEPNWDEILFEQAERGVRAKTLFDEYKARVPDGERAMSLTTFYRTLERQADHKNIIISFDYEPGEMIQVDFVGRKKAKQPVLINDDGEERDYDIVCAASAKSRYTFLLAVESQAKLPTLAAFVQMMQFFGGVPVLITIDNFRAAVAKPRSGKDDAEITPEFLELADFYQFGLQAARVRKPKDKAIVENAVGIMQNDVLAPLRNRRFFSLAELNVAIAERLQMVNERPFSRKTGESRRQLFDRGDFPGYRPLPTRPFEPGQWLLKLRVGRDYRVHVAGSRYSLPTRFVNELVNAKLTPTTVHIAHRGRIVATHPRADNSEKTITNPDHVPPAHRHAMMERLSGLKDYVRDIGPQAEQFIDEHYRINKRPSETAKMAVKLRCLAEHYSAERVDAACARARLVGKRSTVKIEGILAAGLDRLQSDNIAQSIRREPTSNVRGASYFTPLLKRKGGSGDV